MNSPCAACGFDRADWTVQDLQRTLAHADAMIAGWSDGTDQVLGSASDDIADAEPSAVDDAHQVEDAYQVDDVADRVHRLWHRLVTIADLRRARGDAAPSQQGSVTQISRSGGGVPKLAVDSAVVDRGGIVGDVQATRQHHGRPWQALCLWSAEVIDALAADGHLIRAGAVGENITIGGIDWTALRAGTIIDIGSVRCQLSAPATPCSKNRRWFRDGEIGLMDHDLHPGSSRWYASVLRPGSIAAGSPVQVEPTTA